MGIPKLLGAAILLIVLTAGVVRAEDPPAASPRPEDGAAAGRRDGAAADASSSGRSIPGRDFELRPQGRPADILRLIPGLIINQHQGGGKAEQYFLRGFDADHGTDIAIFIDGLPVNLRSHAHGQGYADLHFLIPETVQRLDGFKGPYFPEYGDFATAGAVNFVLRDSSTRTTLEAGGGSSNTSAISPLSRRRATT